MKLTAPLLAIALVAQFAPPSARAEQAAPVTLRVLTYNIHHGEGRDGRFDLDRLARVMASAQPDLVALQEVDRWTERAGGVDQLEELAQRMGMHAEFGKALDYRGGLYGVAVLSRWPIVVVDNHHLPSSPENEQRTALTVLVRAGEHGPLVRITSTHLDQSRERDDRMDQALDLNRLLAGGDPDLSILAGDMNTRVDTEVMAVLEAEWKNAAVPPDPAAPGPPARGRGPRGDFVLFRPADRWRVVESWFIDETVASDHRPFVAVLESIPAR